MDDQSKEHELLSPISLHQQPSWEVSLFEVHPPDLKFGTAYSRDFSRPNLERHSGEVGVYLALYEAKPDTKTRSGSIHYYQMKISEMILAYLQTMDKVEIKGKCERLGVLRGCIIERFTHGLIMVLSINRVKDLDALVVLHFENRLTSLMQSVLVTDKLCAFTRTSSINITARLWEDEYRACREEVLEIQQCLDIVPLRTKPNCIEILGRVRRYQNRLAANISRLRDIESDVESNLPQLLKFVRQVIPMRITSINTLDQFLEYLRKAERNLGEKEKHSLRPYTIMLEEGKDILQEIEEHIGYALEMIPTSCEKASQKELKHKIRKLRSYTMNLITNTTEDLTKIANLDWATKITRSTHGLYLGPLSIIPICVENVIELDAMTDEYISEYPEYIPTV